jgi:hypothetical protein
MNFPLKLKVAMVTILSIRGLAVMLSAFASNLEISGVYSASLSGGAEIHKVSTDAIGEAQFDSNA